MRKLTRALSMLLICCMMFTLLPVTALAEAEKGGIYDGAITDFSVVNYFDAAGVSTNGNFRICGVAIDSDGIAWGVMSSTQVNGDKHGFMNVSIAGAQTVTNPHYKKVVAPGTLTLNFPDGKSETVNANFTYENTDGSTGTFNGKELYLIQIGVAADVLGSFKLFVDSADSGWDILIEDPPVKVNLGYNVIKYVQTNDEEVFHDADEKDLAGENGQPDGIPDNPPIDLELGETEEERTITYKIVVTNTGDDTVYNVNVVDTIPENLTVKSVNILRKAPTTGNSFVENPTLGEGRTLTLESNVMLPVGFEAEYYITAVIDANYKGGTLDNVAELTSNFLPPLHDHAIVNIESYFYIHHIYNDGQGTTAENGDVTPNASEERIDKVKFNPALRRGESFDVTVSGGGVDAVSTNTKDADAVEDTYPGLLKGTLYGGTFDTPDNNYTTVHHQFLTTGENGIDFAPAANEHYYVWEPTDKYLRPNHIYVYHSNYYTHQDRYHTVAGYPVSVVDRDCYQLFGFIHDENSNVNLSEGTYKEIKAFQNYDSLKSSTLTAKNLGLAGYLGCYTVPNGIFPGDPHVEASVDENGVPNVGGTPETFLPFWVTMDGVKVTGLRDRTLRYQGLGPVGDKDYRNFYRTSPELGTSLVETYSAPSATPLMVSAMFMDDNLQHPPVSAAPAPDMVGVKYETITAGNSGNVKRLALSADLSNVYFQEGWFMINNEIRVDAEAEGDKIVAEFKLNKVDEGELTIVPCWLNEDGEVKEGAELVLMVQKKLVEKAAEDSTDANSIGYLTDDEYVEVVVTEETAETEATEEPTETEEATEEPVETEAVEEPSEELTEKEAKKAEKEAKKAEKKNNKKNNKKDELAETEAIEETAETEVVEETTEAPVEVTYEEITTVTFVRSAVRFAEAYDAQDLGFIGIGLD